MFYIVYQVTNKINGKIYIGCHKTENLDDGYMGSGKYLKYSQEKHGIENFSKEILFTFDNPEEMFEKEKELVTEEFISEQNTYNLKIGGFGGFDLINSSKDEDYIRTRANNGKLVGAKNLKAYNEKLKTDKSLKEYRSKKAKEGKSRSNCDNAHFKGKTHTKATKEKISSALKGMQEGEKNSQYGTMWVFSDYEKRSMKISKNSPIPEGWKKGRKIKFKD